MDDRLNKIAQQSATQLPRYEQVKQAVIKYIEDCNLRPGDKLPTEAELRSLFGWSRVTINRALKDLEWEGIVTRIQGSGTFVRTLDAHINHCRILVSSRQMPHDDFCGPLFAGIRDEATVQKVDIVYDTQSPVTTPESLRRLGADGALTLAYKQYDLPHILALHQSGIKVVGLMLRYRAGNLPLICTNNYESVYEAVRLLIKNGHKRIAYVSNNLSGSDVLERVIGFFNAMASSGIESTPEHFLLNSEKMDTCTLKVWWESLTVKPTALLIDGFLALPMYNVLHGAKVSIPQDISIIAVDDREPNQHMVPKLSVLKQPMYKMGRRGLQKLVQMIKGEDNGSPEILPNELFITESVSELAK